MKRCVLILIVVSAIGLHRDAKLREGVIGERERASVTFGDESKDVHRVDSGVSIARRRNRTGKSGLDKEIESVIPCGGAQF